MQKQSCYLKGRSLCPALTKATTLQANPAALELSHCSRDKESNFLNCGKRTKKKAHSRWAQDPPVKLNEERNVSPSCHGGAGQAGSCSTHPCMIWSRWMLRAGGTPVRSAASRLGVLWGCQPTPHRRWGGWEGVPTTSLCPYTNCQAPESGFCMVCRRTHRAH